MEYIWSDYNKHKNFYISAKSPYTEIWDSRDNCVGVNINIRLSDYFTPSEYAADIDRVNSLYQLYRDDPKYRDLFNLICHFAVNQDRLTGLTYKSLIEISLLRRIEAGEYGETTASKFKLLTDEDKLKLCKFLARYMYEEQKNLYLLEMLKYAFGDLYVHFENYKKIYHICIYKEKSEYNQNLYELIRYFFNDIKTDIEVYWLFEHFGIIEVNETMHIDKIVLI